MKTKKILTALLAGALVAGTMTVAAMAQEATASVNVWDGTSYSLEWLNDGNPEANAGDKFYLNSANDLAGFAYYVNNYASTNNIFTGDTVYLNVDVDLGNHPWAPIGTGLPREKNRFYGSFDGQEHTISNLKVAEGHYYAGLFGQIPTYTYTQEFKNVTINNANVIAADEAKSKEAAGALIGRANGAVVDNCHITGEVYISGDRFVGGLIGHSYAQIDECSVTATGTINADTWQAGGLVGSHGATATYVSSVENCVVVGGESGLDITSYYASVGGAIGAVSVTGVDSTPITGITVKNVALAAQSDASGSGISYVASGYEATDSIAVGVDTTLGGEVVDATDATQTKAVASVNGEYFTDLATAFKSVNKDSTIEILSDVTIDTKWHCNFGRGQAAGTFNNNPVVINGNGHTLKFTNEINDGFNQLAVFSTKAALTVNNLTVDMSEAIPVFQNRFSVISTGSEDLTVTGCNFIGSETATNARAIIYAEGAQNNDAVIVVSGCTFKNFRYGVVDNMNGKDVASVTITESKFDNASVQVSASKKVTITDNELDGGYVKVSSYTQSPEQNLTVTVKGNNLDEAFAADNQIQAGTIIDAQEGFILPAATVNGKKYMTLKSAVSAANNGDIVYVAPGTYTDELVINKSIVLTGDPAYGETTTLTADTEKPVIVIKDTTNGGVEYHAPNVVFDNLVFKVAEDATGAGWNVSALGYYYEIVADRNGLTVTNCDFINNSELTIGAIAANIGKYTIKNNTFKNFSTAVWSYVDHGALDTVVIDGNKFENVDNIANVYWGAENAAANIAVTNNTSTDNSTAQISITDFGKTKTPSVTAIPSITVYGNDAEVVLGNMDEKNTYTVDNGLVYSYASEDVLRSMDGYLPDGTVYVQYGTDKEEMFIVEKGFVKEEAQNVKLVFEANAEMDKEALPNTFWDIYLVANEGGILNRLNSADFTFELTTDGKDAMAYEILATNDEIVINNVNNDANRYEFHYDGKTGTITDTATKIKIGTVKFTGFGGYTFAVDTTEVAENTNQVHTTTFVDNIVDSFIVGGVVDAGGNVTNELYVNSTIDSTIIVPTKTLTINIDFPNSVENNAVAYQQMKVVVSGGELEAPLTIDLGTTPVISDITSATYDNKDEIKVTITDLYTIKVENLLEVNTAYNVEVSGAGYRTAKYTVTMTEDKTLNFWNNVKDNAVEVEEKKVSSAKNVTFLAGDIVKDSVINIYDLSAVVSYFGEIDLNKSGEYNAYAKYDLNRDGKIDSKDVAYVLVSWNK